MRGLAFWGGGDWGCNQGMWLDIVWCSGQRLCPEGAEAEKPTLPRPEERAAGPWDTLGEVGVGVGRVCLGSPGEAGMCAWGSDGAELDSCSVTWAWSRGMQTGGLCIFWSTPQCLHSLSR